MSKDNKESCRVIGTYLLWLFAIVGFATVFHLV